jgi:hypothetical protein
MARFRDERGLIPINIFLPAASNTTHSSSIFSCDPKGNRTNYSFLEPSSLGEVSFRAWLGKSIHLDSFSRRNGIHILSHVNLLGRK